MHLILSTVVQYYLQIAIILTIKFFTLLLSSNLVKILFYLLITLNSFYHITSN